MCPPPFLRLFAGSSVMDAVRSEVAPGKRTLLAPPWPRAPKNAPVPPTMARLRPPTGGPGGVGDPLFSPMVIIVPTEVPSLCRISNVSSRLEFQVVSAITKIPGVGIGLMHTDVPRTAQAPFAGWPFTDTISPYPTIGTATH